MLFDFTVKDAIDIFLVALLLFNIYRFMKESKTLSIFVGILVFIFIWLLVSQVLEMRLLGAILDKLISVGALAIIVLFKDEIRKFLNELGGHHRFKKILRLFRSSDKSKNSDHEKIMPIVLACINMARQKVGALIVIERNDSLSDIVATGDEIDASIQQRLIENIFFKNSPLHDGAMVISEGRIEAAGCILPVSHDMNIPRELGLRHRAALGMSQQSDAMCIIVSEETGRISAAVGGELKLRLTAEELEILLTTK